MTSEKNNSKNLIITAIVVVIVGASAFYGGIMYQKSQVTLRTAQFAQGVGGASGRFGGGAGTRGGRGGFGGAVMGDIVSVDSDSITVKLTDGSSKIVNLASTTTYSKSSTGTKTDLAAGTKVAAFGTSNSDGSVTAQNVSINPMIRVRANGPRPTGTQ